MLLVDGPPIFGFWHHLAEFINIVRLFGLVLFLGLCLRQISTFLAYRLPAKGFPHPRSERHDWWLIEVVSEGKASYGRLGRDVGELGGGHSRTEVVG